MDRDWIVTPAAGLSGSPVAVGPYVELDNGQRVPQACEWLATVFDPAPDSPLVTVRLEVKSGKPVCTSLTVTSYADWEPGLSAEKLASIQYGDLIEEVVQTQAVSAASVIKQGGPPLPAWPRGQEPTLLSPSEMDDIELAAAKLHRNRKMTAEHLQKVAGVYLADRTGAPTEAVQLHFRTKHRTATRWVALARERGFLPEYTRAEKEG